MIALFDKYPDLRNRLPYVALGQFPTPVSRLARLGERLGIEHLYTKNDGLSGSEFGGNKIRKLEFLLGDALRQGAAEVLTFGCAGSNHAMATAICARRVGLKSISMLLPQPNAHYVRRNLLMSHANGAELHLYPTLKSCEEGTAALLEQREQATGAKPYVIPAGGSAPLGVVGFVNAAFELAHQIARGDMPQPDVLYVAAGTVGTAAGLVLGLRVLDMQTRLIPVRVTVPRFANNRRIAELCTETSALLHDIAAGFPELEIGPDHAPIREGFLGEAYARFTREAMEAVGMAKELEGVKLEGTYTGKTMSALIADAREGKLEGKTVLFWNTHNARDFASAIAEVDYHGLPRPFHRFFEEPVQQLDRE